ncbi:MAG: Pyruvate kinase, alpha/beta domain [Candidatus Bathyarchaeota archaeon BA2]|nr:MAG: Pyruvate kinase, alpha/beta domain [Candidatus Bathyarchaeota archaeon BA2]
MVVASTSGKTALKFAMALREKAGIFCVSYETVDPKNRKELQDLGTPVIEKAKCVLSTPKTKTVRNAFYTLGQGFKVAIECVLIATEKGMLKPQEECIAVGGTGEGADTAIICRATSIKEMFGKDFDKRLEIKEIVAIPRKKKWWE